MERTPVEMLDPIFGPGVAKSATAQITVMPAGVVCSAELFLGTSETNKAATSSPKTFTSTGAAQNVALPVTMPSAGGAYHVYLDILASGIALGAFQATEDVLIATAQVGPITWA